jgi:hypothetical protein
MHKGERGFGKDQIGNRHSRDTRTLNDIDWESKLIQCRFLQPKIIYRELTRPEACLKFVKVEI